MDRIYYMTYDNQDFTVNYELSEGEYYALSVIAKEELENSGYTLNKHFYCNYDRVKELGANPSIITRIDEYELAKKLNKFINE